jgi:hypothetical protein
MYTPDRPCIVSLENLTEAAALGVTLALEDQSVNAIINDPGTTTGMYAP